MSDVATPKSIDELVALVRSCATDQKPMSTSSGDGAFGDAAEGQRISLRHLAHADVNADAMTLVAGAGATIEAVRAAAKKANLEVSGLEGLKAGHVGTAIARGEVPRHSLCGLDVVLSSGDRVRTGRHLRTPSGADRTGILLGSMGRLGIVAEATFRLKPAGTPSHAAPGRGEATFTVGADLADAFDRDRLLRPGSA